MFQTKRVPSTWAPGRLQRGPHSGRGAKTAGLVNDRTALLLSQPHPHLIQVPQQLHRVLIHTIGAGPFQFFAPIPA